MVHSEEKTRYFSQPTVDIVGSSADPRTHIYQLTESGMMVRYANFKTDKGGDKIEILQFTDTHLNRINQRDIEENNPVVASTRVYRKSFRDEKTVPTTKAALALVPWFDQTVITGDVIDYLTWGSLELMKELITDPYPDVLMPIGMHDLVRKMQGIVDDPTTLESRQEIVKPYWPHDIFYTSRVLGDKVMVVQLNNCVGKYFDHQTEKLKADIERARAEGLIVLIFQHEQMCSHNPKEKAVVPLRQDDRHRSPDDPTNYFDAWGGNDADTDEESRRMYDLIRGSADVIKGVFCGHHHCDEYNEIIAWYTDAEGQRVDTVIPQYVLTGNMYGQGHIMIITVD